MVVFSCFSFLAITSVSANCSAIDVLSVAKGEVGVISGYHQRNKYTLWNGKISGYSDEGYGYPWCSTFVSWCANQAGCLDVISRTASCNVQWANTVGTKHYASSGYIPQAGDLVFFDYGTSHSANSLDHVGFVEYYDSSTGIVHTIEGNYSNSVARVNRSYNSNDIYGFVSPNYTPQEPPTVANVEMTKTKCGLDDTLEFIFSTDVSIDYYKLQIWNGSKLVYDNEIKDNKLALHATYLGSGDFAAYVSAVNSYGSCTSSIINFNIAKRLTNPLISINDTQFSHSDTVEFRVEAEGGVDYYGLQIWKGSAVVYEEQFTGHSVTIPCALLGTGDYAAFISCVNPSSNVITDVVNFRIGYELTNPQISINKSEFILDDEIVVYVSADGGVDYYGIQVWKDTELILSQEFTGHSISFLAEKLGLGTYGCFVSCVNDFGNVVTDVLSFSVVSEYSLQEHSYVSNVTLNPTCTASGIKTYTCTACGDTYTETIPSTGHSWKSASCTAKKTCSTCGATEGAVLGHNYTSKVTKEATCTENGTRTYTCSRCSNSYTETIPTTGHKVIIDEAIPPTLTESGLTKGEHCEVCGEVLIPQEKVQATGVKGDVDGDKKVTIKDVTLIQKHLAKVTVLDDVGLALGDTNGDDKISILDATHIQKFLAKLIPEL